MFILHVVFRYYNKENSLLKKDMDYACMFMCVFYFKKILKVLCYKKEHLELMPKWTHYLFFWPYCVTQARS